MIKIGNRKSDIMHLGIIHATQDKRVADEIVNELQDNTPLTEILNIDDTTVMDNIGDTNGDYATGNSTQFASPAKALHYVNNFFNQRYFEVEIGKYYLKYTQKSNADKLITQDYLKTINTLKQLTEIAGVPPCVNGFQNIITEHVKNLDPAQTKYPELVKQIKDSKLNLYELNLSRFETYASGRFQPLIFLYEYYGSNISYYYCLGADNYNVTLDADRPRTFYIFPQVVSDYHI